MKVFALHDLRRLASPRIVESNGPIAVPVLDRHNRALRHLRLSVTDRCNFRCAYCMPKAVYGADYAYLPRSALLSFEEIERVARSFVRLGVEKIRLTGGEPLLRKNIESLIERLARIRTPSGQTVQLAMTTNGSLLAKKARSLKNAGLQHLTVSLDALDAETFAALNDVDFPVQMVLDGIDTARQAGFASVKVNMVVKRGVNDAAVLPMARYFRDRGITLRFIEFMDVGVSNGWNRQHVVPSEEIIRTIHQAMPLYAVEAAQASDTAQRWRYTDGRGEIGTISSITSPFCGDCTRARVSADGQVYRCLFANGGRDLRPYLRGSPARQAVGDAAQSADDPLLAEIASIWAHRTDRFSETRDRTHQGDESAPSDRLEMSYIGG